MTPEQQKVLEFHRTFGISIEVCPKIPESDVIRLRTSLIQEELGEYIDACLADDIIEVADALGDLLYVVYGAAIAHGIDLEPVFNEIHRSNMTKVGGHKNELGKWVKPATYEPAKIAEVLKGI